MITTLTLIHNITGKQMVHGYPDNRVVVPQIQDETTGVFFFHTLRYKQIKMKGTRVRKKYIEISGL